MKVRKLSLKSFNSIPSAWIVLFGLGFCDLFFKQLAILYLPTRAPLFGSGVIDLFFFQNTGIAFSLPVPTFLSAGVSVGLIGYFGWHLVTQPRARRATAAFSTVVGAVSNLYDRLVHGFVVDYLLLFGHSAINIADILILLGIFFFIRYTEDIN